MATDEDVVVGDRVVEEISADSRCGLDPDLRAAEIRFELATDQFDIFRQKACHVAG